MPTLQRKIKKAQYRLWMIRWLRVWGWSLSIVVAVWILTVLVDRLFSMKWPMGIGAVAGLSLSMVASIVWLIRTREPTLAAAAALDQAADLRERLSTGMMLASGHHNPFEAAVVADAERAARGISARTFVPIRWAKSLSISATIIALALLVWQLPEFDLLNRADAAAKSQARSARQRRAAAALVKPISTLQDVARKNPDLGIKDQAGFLNDPLKDRKAMDSAFKRRKLLKQLDRLEEALQKKADADRFRALKETRKRLRQLAASSDPKNELGRLMANLSAGNFQGAQNEIKKLQERLSKHARSGKIDPAELKAMQKQLNDLASKLKKAAEDRQSQQELQNAGLSKEEAKRVLNALAKKDPRQLQKMAKELSQRLKAKGFSEKQIKQMLKKMQQRQIAAKKLQKLGGKMSQTAKAMEKGNLQMAQQKMGEAGQMLNEMEQMEQVFNDLESQMAQLQSAEEDLSDFDPEKDDLLCPRCNGTGFLPDGSPCPKCNGTGQCGGKGRGFGLRDRDDSSKTSTVDKHAKTRRGRGGSIIGQQFVKGKPLKGQSKAAYLDAIGANEIDPTDSMNRDRIPRIYRNGVRRFFDRLDSDYKPDDQADNKKQSATPTKP